MSRPDAAVARWCGWASAGIGALVLAGWVLDVRTIVRITPSLPEMKANTAIALALSGVALVVLSAPRSPAAVRAAQATGALVAAFGVLVIGEFLLGSTPVDTVLFSDAGATNPGRPSPHTAVGLVLAGLALATSEPARHPLALVSAAANAALGVVVLGALVGYAYGVDYLRGVSNGTSMALHTALGLAVLWLGITSLQPERGLPRVLSSDRSSAILVRRLGVIAVLMPVALGVLRIEGEHLGLFDVTLGVALLTLCTILLFGVLLVLAARTLDAADARRLAAERRFRAVVESAPDAMVVVDGHGEIVLANAAAERLFRYPRRDLAHRPVELLVPALLRERHAVHRRRYAERPVPRPMGAALDLRAVRSDGEQVPVEISLAPIPYDGSTLVAAAIRDVTDRRRAEEVQRRLAAIVEHTDDAILATAPDGTITAWNHGAERLYGYLAAEALGQPVAMLVPPDHSGDEEEIRRHVAAGGKIEQYETTRLAADGRRIEVSLTVSPVRDARGRTVALSTIARDISERKRFEGQLQHLADHDALTGLFNRRRFEEEVDRELERARRYREPGAVLVLDIDHFKYVNDSMGHAAGDELITVVAAALGTRLRATDLLARLGGDEFAVLLPCITPTGAGELAAALRSSVGDAVAGDPRWPSQLTVSIGIAPFMPPDPLSAEDVLVEADIAMYDAKEAGGDRAATYDAASERQSVMQARLTWVERIRTALAEDRFVLHAQPILPLTAEQPPMYELLVRMVGEDGEIIPPGAFIAVAERFGLIQDIDRWVLRRAIALLAREQAGGGDPLLSVNLSAATLGDDTLAALVAAELQAAGADPHGLCIEVTETAAIVNIAAAQQFAEQLRALGCAFSLDDFGAGFASFSYLKHLPFDLLKIDGEFVRHLDSNPVNRLIVDAIVGVAGGLRKRTVAECVEDRETLELLERYGVDYAQGYHVGRARPLDGDGLGAAAARGSSG